MTDLKIDIRALTAMRADLLRMRLRHDANGPIVHHCENLRQMFETYALAGLRRDEAVQAKLEKSIRRQWAALIGLTGGMQ